MIAWRNASPPLESCHPLKRNYMNVVKWMCPNKMIIKMNISPSKILLPTRLKFPSLPRSKWGGYKCIQIIIESCLIRSNVHNIGMVNNFPFDILRHVSNTISHHMTFLSALPTCSSLLLWIPQSNSSDFSPWPFFDPPPRLFVYNADSARLGSGCSTLTSGPGAAMSDSFALNCLSMEVIRCEHGMNGCPRLVQPN